MRAGDDGVRITRTRAPSAILPGLLLLAMAGWLIVRAFRGDAAPPMRIASSEEVPPPIAPRAATPSPAPAAPARDPELAERVQQRREERKLERREKAETPYTLNVPGEHAGIAAFPAPGTKPIKRGIVVPDEVELPEGYVRHYQTTDDGRRLPPILMFHPDFAGVDAQGNPIVVPEDRIVPPELAPPGLGRRTLDENVDRDDRVGRSVHTDDAPPSRRR